MACVARAYDNLLSTLQWDVVWPVVESQTTALAGCCRSGGFGGAAQGVCDGLPLAWGYGFRFIYVADDQTNTTTTTTSLDRFPAVRGDLMMVVSATGPAWRFAFWLTCLPLVVWIKYHVMVVGFLRHSASVNFSFPPSAASPKWDVGTVGYCSVPSSVAATVAGQGRAEG